MTDRYAVIGNPVAHSLSPRIHTLFAAQTGQDLLYTALLAPLDGFAATVAQFAASGGRGLNVTLPFKQQAFLLGTRISARARTARAANTLSFSGDEISVDNTDGPGLVRDLVHNLGCAIEGRRILLLGAGGAARGVVRPLCLEGPRQLLIANRNADRAAQLATELANDLVAERPAAAPAVAGCGLEQLGGQQFDLIINATSASLSDSALQLPAGLFAPGSSAYDMVYGRETPFMRQARNEGASVVADGLGMLVEQAAESFLIWRGQRPDTAPVLRQLRQDAAAQR